MPQTLYPPGITYKPPSRFKNGRFNGGWCGGRRREGPGRNTLALARSELGRRCSFSFHLNADADHDHDVDDDDDRRSSFRRNFSSAFLVLLAASFTLP